MCLLAEELLGVASSLSELRDGFLRIDEEKGHYELHLTTCAEVGINARDRLLNASSTEENELRKGVTGKIRQVRMHPWIYLAV